MSSSSSLNTRPRAATAVVGPEAGDYQNPSLKPAPLRIPSKTRPSTPKIATLGIAGSSSRLSQNQRDGHHSATTPVHHAPVRTTAPSLAGLVSKFEILDAMNSVGGKASVPPPHRTCGMGTPSPEVSPATESLLGLPEDLGGYNHLERKSSSGSISPLSTGGHSVKDHVPLAKDSNLHEEETLTKPSVQERKQWDPLLVAERRKLFEATSVSESPTRPLTLTPSPRKPKLPVSAKSRTARNDASQDEVCASEQRARPQTSKKVVILANAEDEHPVMVKPRPDTPMPGRQTRKTPSVARLRASFELVDQGSPVRMGSIKPAEEYTPTPRKESNVHRRDWAIGDRSSSRVSQNVIEKRSLGRISQGMTPSPLQLHSIEQCSNTLAGPHPAAEGDGLAPSPMSDIKSAPQKASSDPKIAHWKSSPRHTPERVSGIEEGLTRSEGRSFLKHASLVHPLLRPVQSLEGKVHREQSRPVASNEGTSGRFICRRGSSPLLAHPHKVADLRERYDEASASGPSVPFCSKQRFRPELASPTTSLVALSAAIGLATFPGDSSTPSPADTPRDPIHHSDRSVSDSVTAKSPTDHPPKLIKKKQPSPLKDKITIFESLGRPATLAKATSSRAAATVRRRSGDVGVSLKTMVKNGSQMWRRLSGSFDKETDKSPPASSGANSGARPPSQAAQKRRLASRGGHDGFEPRRNAHPCARESTFLVQGTISRVPRGVVSRQQLRAGVTTGVGRARDTRAPSLPDLNFEVDGAADMIGYFEQEFNISFSFTGSGASGSANAADQTVAAGSGSGSSDEDGVGPVAAAQYRKPKIVTKSRASPVLSIRSVHGMSATGPEIPPRNPARRRKSPAASQQRVWDARRRPPTPAPARNDYGGFCDNRPVQPMPVMIEGDGEEDVVVSNAQCGLAHPRPSRVLDIRRFVGYCRETAKGRSAARVVGKL
ncbi:hypothetical protein BR93DRAFT_263967 [Coniochaeta sp. PMI_546]|nr:hypothetical protein BR93DRAFT_263967 [Coniochaeta sp. PMI_546]